jgi:hypothetical protein
MVSIQIDEQTAKALQSAATAAGVSLSEFLRLFLVPAKQRNVEPWENIEHELDSLSVEGSLPSTFTRADIYAEHD